MFKTLRAGIPAQAVRALFVQFVLMVRAKNVFVDQVNVHLDTIYCLIYAINLFVGEVVLSWGSKL